jgi:hypothetical protein
VHLDRISSLRSPVDNLDEHVVIDRVTPLTGVLLTPRAVLIKAPDRWLYPLDERRQLLNVRGVDAADHRPNLEYVPPLACHDRRGDSLIDIRKPTTHHAVDLARRAVYGDPDHVEWQGRFAGKPSAQQQTIGVENGALPRRLHLPSPSVKVFNK